VGVLDWGEVKGVTEGMAVLVGSLAVQVEGRVEEADLVVMEEEVKVEARSFFDTRRIFQRLLQIWFGLRW
jgi:hypothetical protein